MAILGSVNQTKNGGYIVKFNVKEGTKAASQLPLTINNGDALFLDKPADHYEALASRGIISTEDAQAKIGSTPEFVKFFITGVGQNKVG